MHFVDVMTSELKCVYNTTRCGIIHTLELGRHINVNKVHVCKYLFCRWIIASLGDNLMFSLREKISTTQTPMVAPVLLLAQNGAESTGSDVYWREIEVAGKNVKLTKTRFLYDRRYRYGYHTRSNSYNSW